MIVTLLGVSSARAETTIIRREAPSEVVIKKPASVISTSTTVCHGDGCTISSKLKEKDLGEPYPVTEEECA